MSVLGHLQAKASAAVLSGTEQTSINTSVTTLSGRITSWFDPNLISQFTFGSSTRDTILPRTMDEKSDIDYMIVLKDDGSVPQTYLDRMKKFAEKYYSTSEIKQSSPSIVLELNHIKFDLVPALDSWGGSYKIPNGSGGWQDTNPNDFNSTLTQKNKDNQFLIKPTIRLALSYWSCTNQKDYLFTLFDNLSVAYDWAQWRKDRVTRAKQIVQNVRDYEQQGMPVTAESEVKKLIP